MRGVKDIFGQRIPTPGGRGSYPSPPTTGPVNPAPRSLVMTRFASVADSAETKTTGSTRGRNTRRAGSAGAAKWRSGARGNEDLSRFPRLPPGGHGRIGIREADEGGDIRILLQGGANRGGHRGRTTIVIPPYLLRSERSAWSSRHEGSSSACSTPELQYTAPIFNGSAITRRTGDSFLMSYFFSVPRLPRTRGNTSCLHPGSNRARWLPTP
jgi:hypothetical protein